MLTDSYGSRIQTEHIGDGFLPFYNIWGLSWKKLKAGHQNHLDVSSLTCLAAKPSSAEAIGQNTYVWPLLVSWASSRHGGWVPRMSVL